MDVSSQGERRSEAPILLVVVNNYYVFKEKPAIYAGSRGVPHNFFFARSTRTGATGISRDCNLGKKSFGTQSTSDIPRAKSRKSQEIPNGSSFGLIFC